MFYKTGTLWKNHKKTGIIIWSCRDLEELRSRVSEKIEFLYLKEVEDYLEMINRYDPKEFNLIAPEKEKMFLSIDDIISKAIILEDDYRGLVTQYIEW